MPTELPQIHETEIDGVPVFWSPKSGAMQCALTFRVGVMDEPYGKRGISHMVEHLALHSGHDLEHPYNGTTSLTFTNFSASGTTEEVQSFLSMVCTELRSLPLNRLNRERNVLKQESALREAGSFEFLSYLRFGPHGAGLVAVDEHGLLNVSAAELQAWADRYFTKGNAALWLTGPPPDDLRLDLLDGERSPLGRSVAVDVALPAFAEGAGGGFSLSLPAPNTYVSTTASQVIQQRLTTALRVEDGVSYAVQVDLSPVGPDCGQILIGVGTDDDDSADAIERAVAVLDSMAQGEVSESDLRRAKRGFIDFLSDPAALDGVLNNAAASYLVTGKREDLNEEVAKVEALTADDVARLVSKALAQSILASDYLPLRLVDRFQPLKGSAGDPVTGRHFKTRWFLFGDKVDLYVGEQGVSFIPRSGDGGHMTIRWDELVALEVHDDGDRVLIGRSGINIVISTAMWRKSHEVIAAIEEHVPLSLRVLVNYTGAELLTEHPSLFAVEDSDGIPRLVAPSQEEIAATRPHINKMIRRILTWVVLGVLVGVLSGVAQYLYVNHHDRQNDALIRSGNIVQATVVRQNPSETLQAENVEVSFVTKDERSVTTKAYVEWAKNHPEGTTERIAYDVNNPQKVWPLKGGYDPAIDRLGVLPIVPPVLVLISLPYLIRPLRYRKVASTEPRKMLARAFLTQEDARKGLVGVVTLHDPQIDGGLTPVASLMTTAGTARSYPARQVPVLVYGATKQREPAIVCSTEDGHLMGRTPSTKMGVIELMMVDAVPMPPKDRKGAPPNEHFWWWCISATVFTVLGAYLLLFKEDYWFGILPLLAGALLIGKSRRVWQRRKYDLAE